MSTNLTVYGGWVLRSIAALLLFAVFRFFDRRSHRSYLAQWAWSWLAAAIFTATAVVGHSLVMHAPNAAAARLAVGGISGLSGYLQLAFLVLGAAAFSDRWNISRRVAIGIAVLSMGLGLAATAIATFSASAIVWKFFWRLGLRAGLAGGVFLVSGWLVYRARGATRAVGPTLLGLTLAVSGLEQIHYFVISVGELAGINFPYEPQLAVLDVFLVSAVGLGMLMCLLEEERDARVHTQFQAVLAERSRIAREIHDTLAQGFVGIALHLESASEILGGDPSSARSHLDHARSLARDSLTDARRSILSLRPEPSERKDLADALSSAASERLGRPVSLQVRGKTRKLSPEVESNLLRIGQEALFNAASHAGATEVELELLFDSDSVQLRVRDDGHGFDPVAKAPTGHYGLQGMRERVESLGGRFDLQSVPGRGTQIRVRVPTEGNEEKR